jgi:hypothetical protein
MRLIRIEEFGFPDRSLIWLVATVVAELFEQVLHAHDLNQPFEAAESSASAIGRHFGREWMDFSESH